MATLAEIMTEVGVDIEHARTLADEYVKDHESEFDELRKLDVPQLVKAVDVFREAELEDSHYRVEVWLLHHYEPQTIGGIAQPLVRLAGGSTE